MLTTDEAIRQLRANPRNAQLVKDSYWDPDVESSAEAFAVSAEFAAVLDLTGDIKGKVVIDVGAGNGIAAYSFARAGGWVAAIEPNLDDEFGAGAAFKLSRRLPLNVVAANGEALPMREGSVDVAYARQVLHHARDLRVLLREVARILKPGGVFVATREHVVSDATQLARFLRRHPVHQLAGGEHAYTLDIYLESLRSAGLIVESVLGPYDSVINAFPVARTDEELRHLPRTLLRRYFGRIGSWLASVPIVPRVIWLLLSKPRPGRLYAFVARRAHE